MESSRSVGSRYEAVAAEYLEKEGYRILTKNFRSRFGEIDIVAEEEPYLVFVEVKYRTKQSQGDPSEAVDYRKIRKITKTAEYYLVKKGISMERPIRFDIVSILPDEIRLLRNAFDAAL